MSLILSLTWGLCLLVSLSQLCALAHPLPPLEPVLGAVDGAAFPARACCARELCGSAGRGCCLSLRSLGRPLPSPVLSKPQGLSLFQLRGGGKCSKTSACWGSPHREHLPFAGRGALTQLSVSSCRRRRRSR